jgi:trigger factor
MKVTVEDVSSVKKIVHVEIPEETVSGELASAYKELKKTAKVKGFRPGKAPKSVLVRMYKKDVDADVTSKLIQESMFKALQEGDLNIVAPPKVDPGDLEDGKEYKYDATVEINPEIQDIDYKGLSITKTMYKVGDQEIDTQLNMIRKNLASQEQIKEDRPLAENDFALIDYEGFKDGKPFADAQKTENFTLKIGDGTISKEFDDELVGMKQGESREFTVSFAEDYFNPALANQTLEFKATLQQIREEILPEIDDEMAKKLGQFTTLDELKNAIHENVQKGYDQRIEQEINEQIFSALLEKVDFEVPDALTDMELDGIISETEQRLQYQNMSMEDLGLTREGLSEKYRETAEKQVRRHLILGKLINQEKLEVSDENLEKGMQEMADSVNQPIEEIKRYYDQNPDKIDFFKHTLLEKRVLGLIIEEGDVTEVEPELEKPGETEPENDDE